MTRNKILLDITKKNLIPFNARSFKKLTKLKTDNTEYRDFWTMISEDTIYFHAQKGGQKSTEEISIPRTAFDRFLKWYLTGYQDSEIIQND
jgi:hypothetical protein